MAPVTAVFIDRNTAGHVLWQYQDPAGMEPGSFFRQLLGAFEVADPENFARLASVFPAQARAMDIAKNFPEGMDVLRAIHDGGSV